MLLSARYVVAGYMAITCGEGVSTRHDERDDEQITSLSRTPVGWMLQAVDDCGAAAAVRDLAGRHCTTKVAL